MSTSRPTKSKELMKKQSRAGRTYSHRVPLSDDLRSLVIAKLQELCVLRDGHSILPRGAYVQVGKQLSIEDTTVRKLWLKYLANGSVAYQPPVRSGRRILKQEHVDFIHALKKEDPSMYRRTVKDKLQEFSTIENISLSTISSVLTKDLNMTFKKVTRVNKNRFTDDNMAYTQEFIDWISSKDAQKLKFLDESGITLTDAHPRYGHAAKSERAVTLTRHNPHANCTLSLLIGLEGVCYSNVVHGASNMDLYVNFFTEAAGAFKADGQPALECGDVVIVDNASIHHNEAERLLVNFFNRLDIEYIFLPTYSPDFNPVELSFSKIKKLLKSPEYNQLMHMDLKVAILRAVSEITENDCRGYYSKTNVINVE